MNKLTLIGNLTADPITREVNGANGVNKVCNFSIAVNTRRNGQDQVQYFQIAAWNQIGESCQRYLNKGRQVYVEGPVTAQAYQANDGTIRTNMNVNASYIEFLAGNNNNRQDQPQAQPNNAQPANAERPANAMQPAPMPNYGVGQPVDPNAGFTPVETDELPF